MPDTPPEAQVLAQMLSGSWITQGISAAAQLGIADLLVPGPKTPAELARAAGAHADALHRLLRALASIGIFAEDADGRFTLTPLADRLRSDRPDSQRAIAIMMGTEFYETWGRLAHSARTGEQGFRKAFGTSFFEYMTKNPERHAIYDAAMNGIHDPETGPMLDAYDFSGLGSIIDVGGGNGLMLAGILRRYRSLRGVLFELPAVAERARALIAGWGLGDRLQAVGGDFFSSIPAAADACLLRHVIHDWEDEDATAILRTCRKALNPGGRILVVESVIPPGNGPCFGKWLDLMMLLVGGRERTEEQFRRLFDRAGLRLSRILPTASPVSVIEGVVAG